MQENFRKTIKKVAAIGTGIAMLGMTLTGATAVDLSNYPTGLGFGGSDTILVVGANAGDSASDNAAAVDVAAGLPASGTTSGGVLIEGGDENDIPLGQNIATSNLFDNELLDDDLESLQDSQISFHSADYDIHEEILLGGKKSNVSVVSSLSSAKILSGTEDDYETNIYLEVGAVGSIGYYYAFDEAVNISLKASTTNALKIKFLGKTLKIIDVDDDTGKFTAYVGNEYFLNQGESVVVNGKTVTLDNVGSGGAIAVTVDGVKEVISSGNTETVNGIEITNDETFYTSAGKDQTAASLVIGTDASETIGDADPYPGGDEICSDEDPEDPDCWEWDIGYLGSGAATAITVNSTFDMNLLPYIQGNKLGIKNKFVINDDSDNPPGIGDCLSLPNNFASICLDSLTVPDSDYMNLKISYQDSVSLADVYPELTGEAVIKIEASESEGLKLISGKFVAGNFVLPNITKDVKTDTVYLDGGVINDGSEQTNSSVSVYYLNDKNQVRFAGNITAFAAGTNNTVGFMQINYKDTKSTNIQFNLQNMGGSITRQNVTINVQGDGSEDLVINATDDILIQLGRGTNGFNSLGANANSEEADEIVWASTKTYASTIGTKDEDHRTAYGIIIRDPKSHGSSDEVEMDIPGDQVKAKVIIAGSVVQKANDGTTSSAVKLDSEVSDVTAQNVILVGGPCANSLTAQLMGASSEWPTCAEGFTDGEAIIELKSNGDKYAVIAAGYSADDTRRAGVVLKNYAEKLGSAVKTKNSVTVTGTGLEVSGISVA